MRLAPALLAIALAGCQQEPADNDLAAIEEGGLVVYQSEPGPTEVFREATAAAPGHELIVTDLLLGPEAVGAAHYHPWEEYLYIMGGAVVLDIAGEGTRTVNAGEAFIIPRESVHTPVAGPDGVRAIVIRVHDEGDPVRVTVEQDAEE